MNLENFVQEPKAKEVALESNTVTTVLRILNCDAGKVALKDPSGKEFLFSLLHSSGTTSLDVSALPAGAYLAVVQSHGSIYELPFQKN